MSSAPEPTLLGYRPRRAWQATPDFGVPGVVAVASASDCLTDSVVPREPDWYRVNSAFHYPDVRSAIEAAIRAGAPDTDIHATYLYPVVFSSEEAITVVIRLKGPDGQLTVLKPSQNDHTPLGFDVVSVDWFTVRSLETGVLDTITFGCAPLSCNLLGGQHGVNRLCLLDTWERAAEAARTFAREEPEPGPYVVVGTHRVARPKSANGGQA